VILHPGILALIVGSSIVLVMMSYAGWIGVRVLKRWDFDSSSAEQLALERQTYLGSTLALSALGFQVVSALLFLFTVDDIHELFVGAMCATGSLNANPVGWTALAVKVLVLIVSPIWIVFDHLDRRAGDFPIIKTKFSALLLLVPLMASDLMLQIRYFSGLDPEIITSCCGALFSESGSTLASEVASLPVQPMLIAFYLVAALFLATGVACLVSLSRLLRYILAGLSLLILAVSLASIVSFLSLYVYELPTHHCPFDMLQGQYGFIGYPVYLFLFSAVVLGLLPGLFQPLRKLPSLSDLIADSEVKWLTAGVVSMVVFVCVASWKVIFGSLTMVGY
jgi:hypothetical protein